MPAVRDIHSPIPASPRVIYQRNPLEMALCQVRVPPLLRIDVEPPAAFQEAIRAEYPGFAQKSTIALGSDIPEEVKALVERATGTMPTGTAYDFTSEDGNWTVGLTRDFLSLSTKAYVRWEDFRAHLEGPFEAFVAEYRPGYLTRIGLRYQNVIQRSALGLDGRPWGEVLQPHIAGELANNEIGNSAEQAVRDIVFGLGGSHRVRLRHGLARRNAEPEDCYLIDADFYTEERRGHDDAIGSLNELNGHAGRLFRWCVTDLVHEALGPEPVPAD